MLWLYKELIARLNLEYREDPEKTMLKEAICKKIVDSGVDADCPFEDAKRLGIHLRKMPGCLVLGRLIGICADVRISTGSRNRLFSSGLHTLGEPPEPEQMASYLQAYFGRNCQRK